MSLVTCVGCRRHVRERDAACPFCGAARRAPSRARSRVEWALALVPVALVACERGIRVAPAYGGPPGPREEPATVRVPYSGAPQAFEEAFLRRADARGCTRLSGAPAVVCDGARLELVAIPDIAEVRCDGVERAQCEALVAAILETPLPDATPADAAVSAQPDDAGSATDGATAAPGDAGPMLDDPTVGPKCSAGTTACGGGPYATCCGKGQKCCAGGAAGSYHCHSGPGPCPPLP